MNEDARKESVVGGALKLTGVGTIGYGIHKGLMSKKVGEYVSNERFGHSVVNTYREYAPKGINAVKSFFSKDDHLKETKLLQASTLSPEALKNQQNLDNLMSGMHNRRAGKIISDLTGKKRTKVSGRMINKIKDVTKAL